MSYSSLPWIERLNEWFLLMYRWVKGFAACRLVLCYTTSYTRLFHECFSNAFWAAVDFFCCHFGWGKAALSCPYSISCVFFVVSLSSSCKIFRHLLITPHRLRGMYVSFMDCFYGSDVWLKLICHWLTFKGLLLWSNVLTTIIIWVK